MRRVIWIMLVTMCLLLACADKVKEAPADDNYWNVVRSVATGVAEARLTHEQQDAELTHMVGWLQTHSPEAWSGLQLTWEQESKESKKKLDEIWNRGGKR